MTLIKLDWEGRPWPNLVRDPIPPATHFVDGATWKRDGGRLSGTVSHPLMEALRDAATYRPTGQAVIEVRGQIPGGGQSIGGGDAGMKSYVAHWNGTPIDAIVYGVEKDPTIKEVYLYNEGGGIKYLRLHNLIIENDWGDRCIGSAAHQNHLGGLLHLTDVQLRGRKDGSHGGWGVKFGMRLLCGIAYRVDGLTCHGAEEHAIYVNTPQHDERGCSTFHRIWHRGSTRTCFQIVDRPLESNLFRPTCHLIFSRVHVQGVGGDGGAGITVAGHWGPITILDYSYVKSTQAAIAIWHPLNPLQGYRADPDGYFNGSVIVHGLNVDSPGARQDAAQFDRCRRLQVSRRWSINTPKVHWDLGKIGAPDHAKDICFEWATPGLSSHPGFVGTGRKVTIDLPGLPNYTMTDEEIDAKIPLCEMVP